MPQTLRNLRRQANFQGRLRDQNERHSRGDIDRELAARMTKPKQADPVHQVFVDVKGEDGSRPVGPMYVGAAGIEATSQILQTVNAQICLGRLPGWGNARVETAVHTPAH